MVRKRYLFEAMMMFGLYRSKRGVVYLQQSTGSSTRLHYYPSQPGLTLTLYEWGDMSTGGPAFH